MVKYNNKQGISIITPFKNRCDLLIKTIDSVLNQTNNAWELILVNDGSNENDFSQIEKYVQAHAKIKVLSNISDICGAANCRNIGAKNANFDWFVFLDSDDLIGPEFIERRINDIKENAEIDFLVYPVMAFNKEIRDLNLLWNVETEEDDLLRFIKTDSPWHTTSTLWSKSFFTKVIGFNVESLGWQDWEIHVRALLLRPKYLKINETPDVFYRLHEYDSIRKNISLNYNLNKLDTIIATGEKIVALGDRRYNYYLAKLVCYMCFSDNLPNNIKKKAHLFIKKNKLVSRAELLIWTVYYNAKRTKTSYSLFTKLIDKIYYKFKKEHFAEFKTTYLKIKV